jgi:hypothetical protein
MSKVGDIYSSELYGCGHGQFILISIEEEEEKNPKNDTN